MKAFLVSLGVLGIIGLVGASLLLGGLIWMLCLGALGHIFQVKQLEIGYWQSVLVALIAGVLLGGISSSRKS